MSLLGTSSLLPLLLPFASETELPASTHQAQAFSELNYEPALYSLAPPCPSRETLFLVLAPHTLKVPPR
uniref:Putative secreted protein n=1 Tax=Ixodes ricinus TaxID=34613 RepID=A0A6B0TR29_IXORI